MVRPEKLHGALIALHGVLVWARKLANEGAPHRDIADILDWAELLPTLIVSPRDETDWYRQCLEAIVAKHGCGFVLQAFDDEKDGAAK